MWTEGGDRKDLLLQLIPQPHNCGTELHPTQLAKAASSELGKTSQWFSSLIRDNTRQYQQPDAHLLSPAFVASKFKTHLIRGSYVITSKISSLDSEAQSQRCFTQSI